VNLTIPASGNLALNESTGEFVYDGQPDFWGNDSADIAAEDGHLSSLPIHLAFEIAEASPTDPPVATPTPTPTATPAAKPKGTMPPTDAEASSASVGSSGNGPSETIALVAGLLVGLAMLTLALTGFPNTVARLGRSNQPAED
jgi:hypothetical protein